LSYLLSLIIQTGAGTESHHDSAAGDRIGRKKPGIVNRALCFSSYLAFFFGSAFFCAELFFLVGLFFLGSVVFFDIQLNLGLVNYLRMAAVYFFRSSMLSFQKRQLYSQDKVNKDMPLTPALSRAACFLTRFHRVASCDANPGKLVSGT